MSKLYTVEWTIGIEADSMEEAARAALRIQQDVDNVYKCFNVVGENVELLFDLNRDVPDTTEYTEWGGINE